MTKIGSNKTKILVAAGFLVIVLLAYFASPKTVGYGVLADPDLQAGLGSVWGLSLWSKSQAYSHAYTHDGVSAVTFQLEEREDFGWGGIGAYQGRKPFGWGDAPHIFSPIPISNKSVYVVWKGKINNLTVPQGNPMSQCSVGVDLWFEVESPDGIRIAEIFIFFYQQGVVSQPEGVSVPITRSETGTPSWRYLLHHHSQMEIGQTAEYTVAINGLIDTLKNSSLDYQQSTFRLIGVDCHMEVMHCQASYTLDFCDILT